MDDADRSQAIIEKEMSSMLAENKKNLTMNNPSGLCGTCGDKISAARQAALPGCVNCIDCQNMSEGGL